MNESSWRSPSNIALVKYWGKYEPQLPANPSLSFTLKESYTETKVELMDEASSGDFDFEVFLDYQKAENFKPKIQQFLARINSELDFLKGRKFSIHTYNSFPHSSGIASSASGMSALALTLLSLSPEGLSLDQDAFYRKASEWSRLGSGSASRSLYGPLGLWGETEGIANSSDEYAIPYAGKVDPVFTSFKDTILLVETGQKTVSSTAGHGLMKGHPFAEERFKQAHRNMASLQKILAQGNLEAFGELVESEALTLHAMMMSSRPYFILMKPHTLEIINKVWDWRRETQKPLYFTLDAGANVHLLYPESIEQEAMEFVNSALKAYLKNGAYICDQVGEGPIQLT